MSKDNYNTPKKIAKQLSGIKVANLNNPSQRSLVPPVLQEVGKLAAGVASVASGSATGNPRNKHALQPGHSLMDWIRLGSSGRDLTGVGPRAGQLSITPRQLAEHDKETDAWIAIRGKVYNVTQYLPFHPGGPDELMKGIGKDATTLFDQVHAWVNYESLLQKCYLGRLVAIDPSINKEELFFGKSDKAQQNLLEDQSPMVNNVANRKTNSPKLLPPNKVTPLDDSKSHESTDSTPRETNVALQLPRFDWIQKTDYITVIFYTKSFSNPMVEVKPPNADNVLNVCLTYEGQLFTNEITFLKAIQWPCQTKVNYETGKVEIQFKKAESKIWENYGVLRQQSEEASISATEFKCKYVIRNKVEVNYNTSLMELQRVDDSKLTVPIGRHVRVFLNLQGDEISRSYTPVPSSLFTKLKPQVFVTDNICLMIKSYPKGSISKYICGKKKGDVLEVSKPLGSFNLNSVENRETFLLLAAGTGITPIFGVLLFLLERRIRKCQYVTLLFFNKTEEDILVKNQLEDLQNEDNRLTVTHILSQASSKWKGVKGQINQELLNDSISRHLLDTVYKQSDVFVFVCGPTQFTNLSHTLLTDIGFKNEQMHLFLG